MLEEEAAKKVEEAKEAAEEQERRDAEQRDLVGPHTYTHCKLMHYKLYMIVIFQTFEFDL